HNIKRNHFLKSESQAWFARFSDYYKVFYDAVIKENEQDENPSYRGPESSLRINFRINEQQKPRQHPLHSR
ncbi:hypothetical protein, partial [Klebsiella pneumoniae]|uniref:hypothetical protein n=1 Tax=Klebsiella pneumoniae TaxID=573 RepID=UPI001D0D60DB